ncbi:MAG: DUF885 family protein [Puniceicoccaceae bacterium]
MTIAKRILKLIKWASFLVIFLILLGAGFVAHEWVAAKPFVFRHYVDREMIKLALDQPETLTSLGVLEQIGIKGHNAKLDDASPEKDTELYARIPEFRAGIEQYADEELDPNELMTKQICLYLLEMAAESERFRFHNYPVNQLFGFQNGYPNFMTTQHELNTLEDAENYVSRLEAVELQFQQYMEGLKIRENRNIIPPRFVLDRVIDGMEQFISSHPRENILYTHLIEKLEEMEDLEIEDESRVMVQAEKKIEDFVYPAYQDLTLYIQALREKAGTDDGYWRLPDGREAYAQSLKTFTTTNYNPDQLHQIGLEETARIQQEILTILSSEGIDTSKGFKPAIEELLALPETYYDDSDEGRDQILKDYQAILDEINSGLGDSFNIRPEKGVEVHRVPEFREQTAPPAYYSGPSLGGDRPGRFFANLYDIKTTRKHEMRSLAYHEGIPGHHFQIAIALELEGMPYIRRMAPFTAYLEGWAMYAEQLAWELGFEEDPLDNVGRLSFELFRAVRLVVDTGIHAKQWSREDAIDYMLDNTAMAEKAVIAEIERYIVMPGQATSYKVGMIKMLELRDKAKAALGNDFKLSDFHDVVLKNGAVPLTLLETIVDDYIREKQADGGTSSVSSNFR